MKALSIFGLFVLIAFPLGMLFVGFATLELDCARREAGEPPDCEIRESRLFGLYERRAKAVAVSGVGYRTRDANPTVSVTLASTVVLEGPGGAVPVSQAASNVGRDWKSGLIQETRRFLNSPQELALSQRIEERNVFGWIGAGVVGFFLLSYVLWFFKKLTGGTQAKGRSG